MEDSIKLDDFFNYLEDPNTRWVKNRTNQHPPTIRLTLAQQTPTRSTAYLSARHIRLQSLRMSEKCCRRFTFGAKIQNPSTYIAQALVSI